MNVAGEIVGLTNLSFGRGMGVALGLPILTHVADALLAGGTVKRGYLGVSTQSVPLPQSLQTSLGVTQEHGLLVVQVESGGPADAAGLLLGDMLLGLGGTALDDVDDLRRHLRGLAAGQAVTLNLARGGAAHDSDSDAGGAGVGQVGSQWRAHSCSGGTPWHDQSAHLARARRRRRRN